MTELLNADVKDDVHVSSLDEPNDVESLMDWVEGCLERMGVWTGMQTSVCSSLVIGAVGNGNADETGVIWPDTKGEGEVEGGMGVVLVDPLNKWCSF